MVEIMKESLYDLFSDDHGHIDFRRTSGMSKSKQVSLRFAFCILTPGFSLAHTLATSQTQAFVKILQKKAQAKSDATFTMQELYKIAQDAKIGIDHFEQFIDSLNTSNYLLVRRAAADRLRKAGLESVASSWCRAKAIDATHSKRASTDDVALRHHVRTHFQTPSFLLLLLQ